MHLSLVSSSYRLWYHILGDEDAETVHADKRDSSVAEGWRWEESLYPGHSQSSCDYALCLETVYIQTG